MSFYEIVIYLYFSIQQFFYNYKKWINFDVTVVMTKNLPESQWNESMPALHFKIRISDNYNSKG